MSLDPMPDAATLLRLKEEREARARRPHGPSLNPEAICSPSPLGAAAAAPDRRGPPIPLAKLPLPGLPPKMTRVEQLWATHLDTLVAAGELALWRFEAITLVLADDVRYTPDFMLLWADGRVTFDEAKQRWWDDAKAKVRIAARLFPFFSFRVAQKPKGVAEFTVTNIPA